MRILTPEQIKRWLQRTAITFVAATAAISIALVWLWRDRASLDEIDWPPYPYIEPSLDAVTMTWLGVTTLLFDDGETQISTMCSTNIVCDALRLLFRCNRITIMRWI
jgi:hypothetical protein